MNDEQPRQTSGTGAGSAGTGRNKVRSPSRASNGWSTLLVSLRGIEEARAGAAEGRASQYAAMRSLANTRRGEVLDYLRAHAEPDAWRKPGEATAFGTFTIDCTPAGLRILRHAPHVQSVVRTGDTTLRVIR